MHAVLVTVSIEPGRGEEAQAQLETEVLPRVKEVPGVVSGYWTQSADRNHGSAMVVFEGEEAARAAAAMMPNMPRPDFVILDNVEVREVVATSDAATPDPAGRVVAPRAFAENLRIVSTGPRSERGGMIAWRSLPSRNDGHVAYASVSHPVSPHPIGRLVARM